MKCEGPDAKFQAFSIYSVNPYDAQEINIKVMQQIMQNYATDRCPAPEVKCEHLLAS